MSCVLRTREQTVTGGNVFVRRASFFFISVHVTLVLVVTACVGFILTPTERAENRLGAFQKCPRQKKKQHENVADEKKGGGISFVLNNRKR